MREIRTFHDGSLYPGDEIELNAEESHHLASVLRLREGAEVTVLNGRGVICPAVITSAGKKQVCVRLASTAETAPRPRGRWLACGLTKSAAYDDMIPRAVELGMTRFHPLLCERCVVGMPEEKETKKRAKWQRAAVEALKQCERGWLPEFGDPSAPRAMVETAYEAGVVSVVLAERRVEGMSPTDALREFGDQDLCLLAGPEGGWGEEELEGMLESGARPLTLTRSAILRTETAALAALALFLE